MAVIVIGAQQLDGALMHLELLEVQHASDIGRHRLQVACSFTASITPTVSFPFTTAATITRAITITGAITSRPQVLIVRSSLATGMMWWMRPVLAVLLGGCFTKPQPPDVPPDCRGNDRWTMTLAQALPGYSGDPAITGDLRELFYVVDSGGGTGPAYNIVHASRDDDTAVFVPDGPVIASPVADIDPQVTEDGTLLVFLSDRYPQYTTRQNRADVWAPPKAIGGFSTLQIDSWTMSYDGQALYWTDASQAIRRATRTTGAGVTFARESDDVTYGTISTFPTISGDQRELYYNDNGGIQRATRDTLTEAFSPGTAVLELGGLHDAYLAAGDEVLVTKVQVVDGDLRLYERDCP